MFDVSNLIDSVLRNIFIYPLLPVQCRASSSNCQYGHRVPSQKAFSTPNLETQSTAERSDSETGYSASTRSAIQFELTQQMILQIRPAGSSRLGICVTGSHREFY
jgi:hypothetical protein